MFDIQGNKIKFHESSSEWIRSFDLTGIKCLIVCRGPVRKEAMDVFDEIGVKEYGILLSEKDSVVYPMAFAPELRNFRLINNIHRITDYMGSGKEEKDKIIKQIIDIAVKNNYTHIFAGYGFMAEDAEFIEAIETSGVRFMGPASSVAKQAGAKDAAKIIARRLGVSVTPGIDNITALTLVRKAGGKDGLAKIAKENNLNFSYDNNLSESENADKLLQLSYESHIDIITIEDLQKEAEIESEEIWKKFPKNRIRFKYIGGGGGKGQRIISNKSEAKAAVMEILAESKVTGVGSNRNFLIELNIENTRHNEIQLIGNGEWSLALGGRDCSLQMHEQKLLEISNTREMLEQEIAASKDPKRAETLRGDLKVLTEMEEQSERFGAAVKLDSVSTFESIVEGTNHFFMEMNTRIQVEHRVTEMAYKLKFVNPSNANESFIVESLIEAMAMLSVHGKRVPKPTRILRNVSGAEVRINATNQALQPHAGGLIQNWTKVSEFEIRDDQGIGIRNPDTGSFIHYRLAGAYDSNIALLVSYGNSRTENLERLRHIIKIAEMRGSDLQTNMPVHYGLINWILGHDVMFKPNTKFMLSYLAGVGSLASFLRDIDMDILWPEVVKRTTKEDPALGKALSRKVTLITRPIKLLFNSPHLLAGCIGYNRHRSWKIVDGKAEFTRNPLEILKELYEYLDLERAEGKVPCEEIWDHDEAIIEEGLAFYADLKRISGKDEPFAYFDDALRNNKNPAPDKIPADVWEKCMGSHAAFQVGLDIIKIIPTIGKASGFFEIRMNETLDAVVPEQFTDPANITKLIKFLAPPPKAKSDEIIAPMGGMFYSREAPNLPPMIKVGDKFSVGQPLFIVEVMKMFNKIVAPFSGTIVKGFMEDADGKIISKGQPIFKVQPDEIIIEETEEEIFNRKKKATLALLA